MLQPEYFTARNYSLPESNITQRVDSGIWTTWHIRYDGARALLSKLIEASDVKSIFPNDDPYKHVAMYNPFGVSDTWDIAISREFLNELSTNPEQHADSIARLNSIISEIKSLETTYQVVQDFFRDALRGTAFNYSVSLVEDRQNNGVIYLSHNSHSEDVVAKQRLHSELNSIFGGVINFDTDGKALLSANGMTDALKALEKFTQRIGTDSRSDSYQAHLSNVRSAFQRYGEDITPPMISQWAERVVDKADQGAKLSKDVVDGVRSIPRNTLMATTGLVSNIAKRTADDFRTSAAGLGLKILGGYTILASAAGAVTQNITHGNIVEKVNQMKFMEIVPHIDPVTIAASALTLVGALTIKIGQDTLTEARQTQADIEKSRRAHSERSRSQYVPPGV